ncbi:hypothetical protein DEAC_c31110 [Desulfosporosinus acididurans]|uniref:Uncharacterized protein n=1 Tax=Desulfosporosinus acididurans TaxID=476652 RepID=A0A0J1FNS3_9FIRM|nr:hypothetical protein [Desulfosporosinus acididurans]KLU65144.1 hypothetical protein DEAC_c31110 [Desulfosporosinus acididurans]
MDYIQFCEKIWRDWHAEKLSIDGDRVLKTLEKKLDYDACPEPYLSFGECDDYNKTLFFLTTNPGQVLEFQKRSNILSGKSFIEPGKGYKEISLDLGTYYETGNHVKPASNESIILRNPKDHISKMKKLANLLGFENFVEIETIPFHSHDLPKNRIPELAEKNPEEAITSIYFKSVREFLSDKNVICVQAAGSDCKLSDWLNWLMKRIIGIEEPKSHILKTLNNKTTVSLILDTADQKLIRGLTLKNGAKGLPESLEKIAYIIKNRC